MIAIINENWEYQQRMFSYFENGIEDTYCKKTIDIVELVDIIKNNPQKNIVHQIRKQRKQGDDSYKLLKKQLSYTTPNCSIRNRRLADELSFQENFLKFSGYIYIDLDVDISDTLAYKDYFIRNYGHLVSMVCVSCSHGGISVLFKIENDITKENFELYWYYLKEVILKEEPVDDNSTGIGRAMFISHDPHVYYNPDNSIYLDVDEKCVEQYKSWCNINNRTSTSSNYINNINSTSNIILNEALSLITIKEVLKRIKTKTGVNVDNPVLDYNPVDFTSSYFPKVIKDGTKHKIYPIMVHILIHLNPGLPIEYIYSYMYFVNNHFAKPSMGKKEFNRLFLYTYSITQRKDYVFRLSKTKYLHFNPDSNLNGDEKRTISNKLNGKRRVNTSIEKIQEAKQQLKQEGKRISKAAVVKLTGLSRKTVIAHFDSEITNIEKEVEKINENIQSESSSNNYVPPRVAGTGSGELLPYWMDNHQHKKPESPESTRINLDKIREIYYRRSG